MLYYSELVRELFIKTLLELINNGEYRTLLKGVETLRKKSTLLITLQSRHEELKWFV